MSVKKKTGSSKSGKRKKSTDEKFLFEIAWEVCNQVGGIYTVVRSKVPAMIENWGDNYCLIGPYIHRDVLVEFEASDDLSGPLGMAVENMRKAGLEVYYGRWAINGKPRVILFNPFSVYQFLDKIKYEIWNSFNIPVPSGDDLIHQVISFGYLVKSFFTELAKVKTPDLKIVGHFHEWMAGIPIPYLRSADLDISTVFTTHATMLGRYLAMNSPTFYENLSLFDAAKEAKFFNIESQVAIERAATHGCHVFSTVSDVTANECSALLGRTPDIILPNGLNIERFEVMHEFQNIHRVSKERIHQFTMGHFFPTYSFDLDNTLYFFTSGRYEYKNKGFDITLEALAKLNWRMKQENIDTTVIMFFITKRPYYSINPRVLHSGVIFEKIRRTCQVIEKSVGEKLFHNVTNNCSTQMPSLDDFVDEYWSLRLRKTIQSWKTNELPLLVTHTLEDRKNDEILKFLSESGLHNQEENRVKIIYHPDFLSSTSPIHQQEYDDFVRGCHLGVFPSFYEPWGYTPLECIARGLPTITSNLSGFGNYVSENVENPEKKGIYVVDRKNRDFNSSADQLVEFMLQLVKSTRRERITQRNIIENSAGMFDWKNLTHYYQEAYKKALSYK